MKFITPRIIQWLCAYVLQTYAQTHVTSPHRSLDHSFSEVTLNPTDEYLARKYIGNEWGYEPADETLPFDEDTESFITFDLKYSWLKYLEDYLSSATLRMYSLSGAVKVDFDVLTEGDNEWTAVDVDASTCDSHPCWVEVDVTDGLLWTIERDPNASSMTIRISANNEIEGMYAASSYDKKTFAPELLIDFDRHENLAGIQADIAEMKSSLNDKKKSPKKDKKKDKKKPPKKGNISGTKVNVSNANRPNKKPNANKKKPGKKGNISGTKVNVSNANRPNKRPNANKKKPGKKPGRPNANKKPNADAWYNMESNANPKPIPSGNSPTTDDSKQSPINSGDMSNTFSAKEVIKILTSKSIPIDNKLFLYESPVDGWIPSSIYKNEGLIKGLKVMNGKGVNGMYFYLGGEEKDGYKYGLANVAAFLAQSMKETIKYDACDENSWDLVNGRYPLSNACGQLHQSYQDYHCPDHERHMECPVDPEMEITAVTHAKWYGAPAPLFCRPKKDKNDFTGSWNYGFFCNVPWVDPPITCDDYPGQKAGRFENDEPYPNRNGRTDVEGCCWWGRGVIQTTGVCNFGKLNYYLGARAAKEGRDAPYAQYDFCKDPEVICSSEENKELKWIAGMFYWMESVQKYDSEGWNYMSELKAFVDGKYKDPGFINAVSGIVNRGCHNPPCGTGAVDGGPERAKNFQLALGTFGLIKLPKGNGGGGGVGNGGGPKTVCGVDWKSASKCERDMKECQSTLDCPSGQFCWAGVVC